MTHSDGLSRDPRGRIHSAAVVLHSCESPIAASVYGRPVAVALAELLELVRAAEREI